MSVNEYANSIVNQPCTIIDFIPKKFKPIVFPFPAHIPNTHSNE